MPSVRNNIRLPQVVFGSGFIAFFLVTAAAVVFSQSSKATDSARLAKTPPMGWNSWNKFSCDVSERLIRETADAMVASGMRDVGYQYVNIDDCWQVSRDSTGTVVADPARFPSGIKALADYVHDRGLKLGITLHLKTIGVPKSVKIRDLWEHKDLGTGKHSYAAEVPKHGVVMLKLSQ